MNIRVWPKVHKSGGEGDLKFTYKSSQFCRSSDLEISTYSLPVETGGGVGQKFTYKSLQFCRSANLQIYKDLYFLVNLYCPLVVHTIYVQNTKDVIQNTKDIIQDSKDVIQDTHGCYPQVFMSTPDIWVPTSYI